METTLPSDDYNNEEIRYEKWQHWPINWTAVVVGALAALSFSMLFALTAAALGAQQFTPEHRIVDLHKVGMLLVAFAVLGAFFSFVIGGWAAGRIAGILHSEPAMLHGAIVWLVAVPLIALFSTLGAGGYNSSWYGGLGYHAYGSDYPYAAPPALSATATDLQRATSDADWAEYRRNLKIWRDDSPRVARNAAMCAVTSLLIAMMGAVIGGWAASGEPMSIKHKRVVIVSKKIAAIS